MLPSLALEAVEAGAQNRHPPAPDYPQSNTSKNIGVIVFPFAF
jgi:hypothetical protein